MADYMELGASMQGLVDSLTENTYYTSSLDLDNQPTTPTTTVADARKRPLSKNMLEVRKSVCVAGFHRDGVQTVKNKIGELMLEPLPLESFHVKHPSDVKDGAFLVPKIVLVAMHCPGRKLLDDEGDEGQLDFLYDEACDIGADIMVVYLGLPKSIYPAMRHIIYHPKINDMLFPSQPLLRELASENCFITVTENTDLTNMQKNVIREWISKPVGNDHSVYKTVDYLSSLSETECTNGDSESWYIAKIPPRDDVTNGNQGKTTSLGFLRLPVNKKSKKEKRKKGSRSQKKLGGSVAETSLYGDLTTLTEAQEEIDTSIELDMYRSNEFGIDNPAHVVSF